jgi:hypothetical protein
MDKDAVKQVAATLLGMDLSDAEAVALTGALEGAARGMAQLPSPALKDLEPALRSQPGPLRQSA